MLRRYYRKITRTYREATAFKPMFERLTKPGPYRFVRSKIRSFDEHGVDARFFHVLDIFGRRRFEERYLPRAPAPGEDFFPEVAPLDQPAVVLGRSGWVVTQQGWLQFASFERGHSFLAEEFRARAPAIEQSLGAVHLAGTTLLATTDYNWVYGHTLWEAVYRILAYWDRHGSFDDVDQILTAGMVPRLLKRFDPDILEAATPKLRTHGGQLTRYVCDNLVIAPLPVSSSCIGLRQIELLNKYVRFEPGPRPKNVFLLRKPGLTRTVSNQDEVLSAVRSAGYEPVAAGETPGIFGLFAEAERVVGIHGSDLCDIVFMQPGRRVLELTPTDHVKPYFRVASQNRGLDHHNLLCASASHRLNDYGYSTASVHVDIGELKRGFEIIA